MGQIIEKMERLDYWLIAKVRKWALPFAGFSIFESSFSACLKNVFSKSLSCFSPYSLKRFAIAHAKKLFRES